MEIATLNTKYLTRSPLKIKVIRVDSSSLFWIQLNNNQEDFKDGSSRSQNDAKKVGFYIIKSTMFA